jgi:hypothetical protein
VGVFGKSIGSSGVYAALTFGLELDADDLAPIETVLAKSRDLMQLIGDCGDEYRWRPIFAAAG